MKFQRRSFVLRATRLVSVLILAAGNSGVHALGLEEQAARKLNESVELCKSSNEALLKRRENSVNGGEIDYILGAQGAKEMLDDAISQADPERKLANELRTLSDRAKAQEAEVCRRALEAGKGKARKITLEAWIAEAAKTIQKVEEQVAKQKNKVQPLKVNQKFTEREIRSRLGALELDIHFFRSGKDHVLRIEALRTEAEKKYSEAKKAGQAVAQDFAAFVRDWGYDPQSCSYKKQLQRNLDAAKVLRSYLEVKLFTYQIRGKAIDIENSVNGAKGCLASLRTAATLAAAPAVASPNPADKSKGSTADATSDRGDQGANGSAENRQKGDGTDTKTSTKPASGAQAQACVMTGPPDCAPDKTRVPHLRHLRIGEAVDALSKVCLAQTVVEHRHSYNVQAKYIIEHSPYGGACLLKNSSVALVVSLGPPQPQTLTVEPAFVEMEVGQTVEFAARLDYSDGTHNYVTYGSTWSPNSSYKFTPSSPGTFSVTASFQGTVGAATAVVSPGRDSVGRGDFYVYCSGEGQVYSFKGIGRLGTMHGPFVSQAAADGWIGVHCPSRRCDRYFTCLRERLPQPESSQSSADGGLVEQDTDGIPDHLDNCPEYSNPLQHDKDSDGVGDACDGDIDGDGKLNTADACPEDTENRCAAAQPESATTTTAAGDRDPGWDADDPLGGGMPTGSETQVAQADESGGDFQRPRNGGDNASSGDSSSASGGSWGGGYGKDPTTVTDAASGAAQGDGDPGHNAEPPRGADTVATLGTSAGQDSSVFTDGDSLSGSSNQDSGGSGGAAAGSGSGTGGGSSTPQPQPDGVPGEGAGGVVNFGGTWTSNARCQEQGEGDAAFRWRIALAQNDRNVKGTIAFHKCPGGGRVTYLVKGQATDKDFVKLIGTKASIRGPLGGSAPSKRSFVVRRNSPPDPDLAGGGGGAAQQQATSSATCSALFDRVEELNARWNAKWKEGVPQGYNSSNWPPLVQLADARKKTCLDAIQCKRQRGGTRSCPWR